MPPIEVLLEVNQPVATSSGEPIHLGHYLWRELDAAGLAADTLLVYDLGLRLANSREWPQGQGGSEFAAARHASNDQRAN